MKNMHPRAFVCISHSPFMTLPALADFGPEFRKNLLVVKNFIEDFSPDLVVMFAPDHLNMFEHIRPPFTTIISATSLEEFSVPKFGFNIDVELAARACEYLSGNDIDIAAAEDVEIDHGLTLTLTELFAEPSTVPLLAFVMNVIGFPLSPLRRSLVFGEAVGRFLSDFEGSVLFIGTGGLSHDPPFPDPVPGEKKFTPEQRKASLASAVKWIDAKWDCELLEQMRQGNSEWFYNLTQAEISKRGGGANEIRVWGSSWAACGYGRATFTSYESVPEWITGMGIAYGIG